MKTRFRWVYHEVYGWGLYFDVSFKAFETCSKEDEFFPIEIKLPVPILKMIAGKKIPEMPKVK